MIVLGIDPGKGGGLCMLRGHEVLISKMDTMQSINKFIKRTLDDYELPIICFIERVNMWSQYGEEVNIGKQMRVSKMVGQYESLITLLEINEIPIVLVHPRTWQNYLKEYYNVKPKSFKYPKNAFKGFAIERYPRMLKSINLATADAVCIAHYGKCMLIKHYSATLKMVKNKETLKLL